MHVVQNNGNPIPPSLFTAPNTAELVQHVMETLPINIEIVTDRQAVVELDKSILAVDVMQQLQGRLVWGCHVTEVTCLLFGKECVMNILRECKVAWEW